VRSGAQAGTRRPARVGSRRASLAAHHHGRVGNPPRVPITIVGRRQIEARMSLQEQMASRWSPAVSGSVPRPLPRAAMVIPLGARCRAARATNLEPGVDAGHVGGKPALRFGLAPGGFAVPLPSPESGVFYHAVSPLPDHAVARAPGGLFSVALSFESSRLAVNQHPAHGARTFLDGDERPATIHRTPAGSRPSIARLRSAPCPIPGREELQLS